MKVLKRMRVSPAMAVALVALFMAMGGTAFAQALIGGDDIIDGSITGADVKNNSLNTKDVAGLRGVDIRNGSITTKDIRDGSLLDEDIDSVSGDKVDGPVAEATSAVSADTAANADRLGDLEASEYQTALRWVRVDADGSIDEQSGGFTVVEASGAGGYWIDTGEDLVNKALLVTARWGQPNTGQTLVAVERCGDATGGVTCLAPGTNTSSHVFVLTEDEDGSDRENGFYFAVIG